MRPVRALPAVPGPQLYAALRAALDGTGPALLPLPTDPAEQARVRAALRPDLPEPDDEVAVLVPTSGSTGEPKGVLLTTACLTASARAAEQRLGGPASWLLTLPVTHVGGLQVLLRALLAGTEPVVTTDIVAGTAALPPGRRHTSMVPTQLRRALADPAATLALATYDALLLGGAAAPPALLQQARRAGIRVVTTYGMSETSGGCVYDGVPLPGVTAHVGGRISLQGPVVARGYRLRPDLTAASFAGDTFTTGDVGRWDGDRLVVLGRADDVVVTGGEKVAPAAVEAVLAELLAVAEVVVVGVPDAEWGARVVAHVVLREGATLSLQQVRAHVGAVLGRRSAPRELRLHAALPLLASGKPDRAALRSWL
ncbi:MAG TPA: o-succinylbenzoate--CoA ligase [Mycobacteriales bacterium]|nr:o-succinylbenzoate--CoA ligase [Mycobacteriales bacterium]